MSYFVCFMSYFALLSLLFTIYFVSVSSSFGYFGKMGCFIVILPEPPIK